MSIQPKTKALEIEGRTYQFRKLAPDVGTYILFRLLAASLNSSSSADPSSSAETSAIVNPDDVARSFAMAGFLRGLGLDDFRLIQRECMKKCSRMESTEAGEIPTPVMMEDGRFAIPELADNMTLITRLTMESLVFNFSDFFAHGGLGGIAGQPSASSSVTITNAASGNP